MITFLPYPNFAKTAKALDSARLGKQRGEALQILIAIYWETLKKSIFLAEQVMSNVTLLVNKDYMNLRNNPITKMWSDYPFALASYGIAICEEWISRGKIDNTMKKFLAFQQLNELVYLDQQWLQENKPQLIPPWLGLEKLHQSHRGRLIAKEPTWYRGVLGWTDSATETYWWPEL